MREFHALRYCAFHWGTLRGAISLDRTSAHPETCRDIVPPLNLSRAALGQSMAKSVYCNEALAGLQRDASNGRSFQAWAIVPSASSESVASRAQPVRAEGKEVCSATSAIATSRPLLVVGSPVVVVIRTEALPRLPAEVEEPALDQPTIAVQCCNLRNPR